MLKEASTVETLQRRYDLLFGADGRFATSENDSEDEMENIGDDEAKAMEALRKRRQKYKSQKIRFDQIQRLLKASKVSIKDQALVSSFYSDAWPASCVLLAPTIRSIYQRTSQLLKEFEAHPMLVRVLELVRQIMLYQTIITMLFFHQASTIQNLPVFHTTTMSLVNALELLLDRCERWEKFAHRDISLKSEMSQLKQRIVILRHQQLQDWRELRNFHESAQAKEGFLWTPDLVLTLQAFITEKNEDDTTTATMNYLSRSRCQTLWSYLEESTLSKPIGQFDSRLQVVKVISYLLRMETSNAKSVLLGNLLGHFYIYSRLALPKIELAFSHQRKMMDKEIKGLVKITGWDFTRHQLLRESIHKTHYQLGKVIKRFDAFLQEPVIGYLSTPSSDIESVTNGTALENMILRRSIYELGPDVSVIIKSIGSSLLSDRLRCIDGGMMGWVRDLIEEIRPSLLNVDTTTSTVKKRWILELRNRLMNELKIQLLVSINKPYRLLL